VQQQLLLDLVFGEFTLTNSGVGANAEKIRGCSQWSVLLGQELEVA
jgi:hypothetical protein